MNPDMDDLAEQLKDGIDRLTEEVSVPAGLASRARWHRAQQSKFRKAAGSGAAVVAVVGLLAATLAVAPPQLPGTSPKMLTVAYVTGRIEQAMAKASTEKQVEQVTVRATNLNVVLFRALGHTKNGPHLPALVSSRIRFWFYRSDYRTQGLTSAGKPLWDNVIHTAAGGPHAGRETGYGINYDGKTWWRAQMRPQGPRKLQGACNEEKFWFAPWAAVPRDWTAIIASALKCDSYKVAGYQRVDGQKTIKLVPVPGPDTSIPATDQTLWVAPSTYLPVRVAWAWHLAGQSPGRMVSDFAWSKPSKAILAPLHPPVPDGFKELKPTLLEALASELR